MKDPFVALLLFIMTVAPSYTVSCVVSRDGHFELDRFTLSSSRGMDLL